MITNGGETTARDASGCETDLCPEEVLRLLHAQAALYDRLETFARKQRALVAREDTAPLLALLADRQKLSSELQLLARRLEPVRRDWARHRNHMTAAQRQEADALLAEVRERLQRVLESDEQDARVLAGRKAVVGTALQKSTATGRAITAYYAASTTPSHDRLDEAS